MKNNFVLFIALGLVLLLTWMLTEKKIFQSKSELTKLIEKNMENVHTYKLPYVTLSFQNQWLTEKNILAKASHLNELDQVLQSFLFHKKLENIVDKNDFFQKKIHITINELILEIGDLTPAGDGFYVSIQNDPSVYVVDLNQLSSEVMADQENILNQSKYERMRDILLLPENKWRETKLIELISLFHFKVFKKNRITFNYLNLMDHPLKDIVLTSLSSSFQTLEVFSDFQYQKPKQTQIFSWEFVFDQNQTMFLEFYPHPDHDLLQVWIPQKSLLLTLTQESSDFVKIFPEKLVHRPFDLQFKLPDSGIELLPVHSKKNQVEHFLSTKQTFDELVSYSDDDCKKMEMKRMFESKFNNINISWIKFRHQWVLVDCKNHLGLSWKIPLDSPMDFDNLK